MALQPSRYHRDIKKRIPKRPGLTILDCLLDDLLNDRAIRLPGKSHELNVTIVHILKSGSVETPIKCHIRAAFEAAIIGPPGKLGSVVIAKDFSYEMVETLGMRLGLEPEFFALHLR